MRLHRLCLEAFGPFAVAQEIDFDRLGASGLFLLEGPTGAGKTSILDAVTFALYGGLSGRESGNDRQHSHFAAPTVEPSVELEFSVRGLRHRVRRTPEWSRPKKRSTGLTRQAASVHLERREGGSWVSLSTGKAEAGELITDLLGLNRDQFTQVVLLPQGEFAQFLRAGDDERRVLLTKIFGTGLYDEITAEFARRRTVAQKAVEQARSRQANRLAAAAEAAGLAAADSETWTGADDAEQDALLREVQAALIEAAATADSVTSQRSQAVQAARAADERASHVVELARRRQLADAAWQEHERGTGEWQTARQRLAAARRVSGVRPLVHLVDETAAGLAEIRALVRDLGAHSPELLEGPGTEKQRADALVEQATRLHRTAESLQPLVDQEERLPELRDHLTAAQLHSDAATKRLDRLNDRQAELPELVKQARSQLTAAREAAGHLGECSDRQQRLTVQLTAATELIGLAPVLVDLRERRSRAIDDQQQAVDLHQHLLELRLRGMAAELAGELHPRQPCGVCGSKTHPSPAQPTLDAVSPDDVESAAAARQIAESVRTQLDNRWNQLNERLAALRATAGEEPPELLTQQLTQAKADLQDAQKLAATLTEAEATLTEREVELDVLHTSLQQAIAEAADALAANKVIAQQLLDTEAAVLAALDGSPSVRERQNDLGLRAALARELADAVAELSRSQQHHDAARARAEAAAIDAGYDDIDAVRAAMLDDNDIDALDGRVSEWERSAHRLRDAADPVHFDGVQASALDAHLDAAAVAAAEFVRAQEADQAAQAAAATASRMVERFADCYADFRAAAAAVQSATAAARDVIYLADLTRGMDGHRRMNLTTYVLRRWFDRVVEAANTRLSSMSSGRYALVRTDVGARANERSGLTLRVVDQHTGEERATTSMSGGETFYTSLALALGLADVVAAEAGGVELDTLFIDEGFGSLDAETLDQVMAVIDDLRDRGRVIGIVSHVADLKDRVQERLEVHRLADGSSAVRVLA